jgi:hypothetical protein
VTKKRSGGSDCSFFFVFSFLFQNEATSFQRQVHQEAQARGRRFGPREAAARRQGRPETLPLKTALV